MGQDHYRCPVPGGDGGWLGAMLRAGARGVYADEAAVDLLLRHGHWAGHGEFVRRFTQVLAGAPGGWNRWRGTPRGPGRSRAGGPGGGGRGGRDSREPARGG